MRHYLLLLSLLFVSYSYGHEYFFAYAEIEYNDISQKFETTLVVSSHDMELVAKKEGFSFGEIKSKVDSSGNYTELENYLAKHFEISIGTDLASFHVIGYEVLLNGTSNIYLESDAVEIGKSLFIKFDLFMNIFSKQQNKASINYRGTSYTEQFILSDRKKEIKLEKK